MANESSDAIPSQQQPAKEPAEAKEPADDTSRSRKRRSRGRKQRRPGSGGSITGTSTRHQARILALQTLYEYDIAGHDDDDLSDRLRTDDDVPPVVREYASTVFTGVLKALDSIDTHIREAAPQFPVAQLAAVDRNVLRIAVYELMNQRKTVPVRVAINEAIEIAKDFGSDNSSRFIHGALGTIAKSFPDTPTEGPPSSS